MGTTTNQNSASESIALLVNRARAADLADRRSAGRYSYFRPVSVMIDSHEGRNYSAFSREISATGMGLLHNMPLEPGMAVLKVCDEPAEPVIVPCEIKWCRPAGEGWYLSGVSFISAD